MNQYNPYNPYQYSYQNYQNNQNNQNIGTNQYTYVNGIEGAKAYTMMPNQTVLLMDSDNPIFYMKQSNALGQSTIRTFRFEEIKESEPSRQYVSINDFNDLKSKVDDIITKLGSVNNG